ncbi:MAG: hypothetical protein HQK54_05690 [Oligoflexales bacterium]|nr:hypothetical protein [Oligoflexales bacterium]
MLSYAFGIGMINQIIKKENLSSSIMVAASMVIHPIVALPFCLVWGIESVTVCRRILRKSSSLKYSDLVGFIVVFLGIAFLGSLSVGQVKYPSQIELMLSELTVKNFIRNIFHWLNYDTFSLGFFCIILLLPWVTSSKKENRGVYLRLCIWFVGANLINGAFGSTEEFHYTATFQSGFSVAAVWVISTGIIHSQLKARIGFISGLILCFLWMVFIFPGIELKPSSVFTTHSDIRVSKYISKNLPQDALIVAVTPYSELWRVRRNYFSYVRGNSYRNTVFSLVGKHQVKNGNLLDKNPFSSLLGPETTMEKLVKGSKKLGATHVLVLSRPETEKYIADFKQKALFRWGNTYLFQL